MEESGLWLIGLGPGDLNRMSIAALSAAKSADYRFLEGYTALLPPAELSRLEEVVGPWALRMRSSVEDPDELLELLKNNCDKFASTKYGSFTIIGLQLCGRYST